MASTDMQDIGHVQLAAPADGDEIGLRIATFTDLHQWPRGVKEFKARGRVIDFDKEGYSAEKNIELMEHVLERSSPDLVVFTGDILDGRPCKGMAPEKMNEVMMDVLEPVLKRDIPWTYIPGNHDDDDSPWTRQDLLKIYQLPLCVSAKATTFNHTMTIGRGTEPSATDSVRLWLFDSGTNSPDPKLRYTTFSDASVRGYTELSESGKLAPSATGLAFFHIPLPEYENLDPLVGKNGLFEAALKGGKVPFPFNFRPMSDLVEVLGKDRVVGCSKLNSGIFEAFRKQGNILATFCGHDHHSDFVARRDNIYLCYNRCGSYTPPSDWEGAGGPLKFDHGSRIIHFKGADQLWTWNCTFKQDSEDLFHLKH
ncbi:Probable inactive purple acid phosphatase 29 [Durusdinium trenchii]|uniref:Probable inactive purple acid phosphatase 29 n=1 Tax=Durusdinium trenchii TaxID=1381693 RepID=A0ABP0K6A7_9DINO